MRPGFGRFLLLQRRNFTPFDPPRQAARNAALRARVSPGKVPNFLLDRLVRTVATGKKKVTVPEEICCGLACALRASGQSVGVLVGRDRACVTGWWLLAYGLLGSDGSSSTKKSQVHCATARLGADPVGCSGSSTSAAHGRAVTFFPLGFAVARPRSTDVVAGYNHVDSPVSRAKTNGHDACVHSARENQAFNWPPDATTGHRPS